MAALEAVSAHCRQSAERSPRLLHQSWRSAEPRRHSRGGHPRAESSAHPSPGLLWSATECWPAHHIQLGQEQWPQPLRPALLEPTVLAASLPRGRGSLALLRRRPRWSGNEELPRCVGLNAAICLATGATILTSGAASIAEFHCYRDLAFYAKFFLNPDKSCFPEPSCVWTQRDAQLQFRWNPHAAQFDVCAFRDMHMHCRPPRRMNEAAPPLHRFSSNADPSAYTKPYMVEGEDDILHSECQRQLNSSNRSISPPSIAHA